MYKTLEEYLIAKELIERAKEVFNFLGKKVHVLPIPYQVESFKNTFWIKTINVV